MDAKQFSKKYSQNLLIEERKESGNGNFIGQILIAVLELERVQ